VGSMDWEGGEVHEFSESQAVGFPEDGSAQGVSERVWIAVPIL